MFLTRRQTANEQQGPRLQGTPQIKGALLLRRCDELCCLLPEGSGSLAGLAFKAGNEMPALVVDAAESKGVASAKRCPSRSHCDHGALLAFPGSF